MVYPNLLLDAFVLQGGDVLEVLSEFVMGGLV